MRFTKIERETKKSNSMTGISKGVGEKEISAQITIKIQKAEVKSGVG